MKQIINFIFSDKGYITVVFLILGRSFFISKKNLYDEKDKVGSSLKITLTMFILVMVGVAGYIISFGTNITDANILSSIVSFTAPFIAFSGAYLIFEFGQKKADREKKIESDTKLEYKKLMLFNLLDYTILKTDNIYQELNNCYLDYYTSGFKLPTEEGFENEIRGNLYNDCVRIYSLYDRDDVKEFNRMLKSLFNGTYLREHHLYEHIYDNNWTSYLDCIPSLDNEHYIENIQRITTWIILLQNSKVEGISFKQIDPIDFVLKRRGIDGVIDELAPEIKEKGFRSKYNMINQEIYRPERNTEEMNNN